MALVTAKDAKEAFGMLQTVYPDAIDWTLQEGSPINGRSWRILARSGNRDILGSNGFIGYTARNARDYIIAMMTGILLERERKA